MRYKEKAVLVAIDLPKKDRWEKEQIMNELKMLASSCGARDKAEVIVPRKKPNPAFFIGKGKIHEIADLAERNNADIVIFNEDLSPAQERNIEKIVNVKVIDRSQLILDVFAKRAKSNEGKIQVELAQLEYLLPRLSGRGEMLSRLGAGIGTRGPGEQKLEIDRRRIQERIIKLKKNLKKIEKRRHLLREKRKGKIIPTAALVGYTNSGKSTLINALTNANQNAQNRLFSTLDPVVRKLNLPNNQTVLISDTVGFLHNLPHHLIESFKATLEEVIESDVLVHVLDITHPQVFEHREAVYAVLGDLGVMDKPMITVLNKIDKVSERSEVENFQKKTDNCVNISALYRNNLNKLVNELVKQFSYLQAPIEVLIPNDKMNLIDVIHMQGQVKKQEYRLNGVYVKAEVPVLLAKKLHSFLKRSLKKRPHTNLHKFWTNYHE